MFIPERSSRVRKWIVSIQATKWVIGIVAVFLVMSLFTSFMTLRYFARLGEFKQTQLRSRYLEGQLQLLQNKLTTADSTLVRVQNFEQKLRVLARLDRQPIPEGYGPISGEEETILKGRNDSSDSKLAMVKEVSPEFRYKMKSMETTVESLSRRASLQEQSLQQLYELLKDQQSLLASTPSIMPTRGWMASHFGYRVSPFTGLRQLHTGIDIAAPAGTEIVAAADGIVSQAATEEGFGKVVSINHGYGVVTRYAHNSKMLVSPGQRVNRGQVIALVGATGRATGTHLHYEVRVNGIPVNPIRYILN